MSLYWGPALVGSRVSKAWMVRRERYIDLKRDKERICSEENRGEKEADVPCFTQKINKVLRQETCTVYVGPGALPVSRGSEDTGRLPVQVLEAQANK